MPQERHRTVYVYAVCVSALGALLGVALFIGGDAPWHRSPFAYAVLLAFVIGGEIFPIKVGPRSDEEITTSTTFSFALLLMFGLAGAALAQAIASALADVVERKSAWKLTFNAAQYALSLAAAGAVLSVTTNVPQPGPGSFGQGDIPGIVLAAGTLFLTNVVLAGTAIALSQRAPLLRALRDGFWFQARTDAMLMSLAPVVVVTAEHSLGLAALLSLPLAAIYLSAQASAENDRLIGALRIQAAEGEYASLHDSLTALPNRTHFHQVAEAALTGSGPSTRSAVMLMDLDRFKEINDALGHQIGDELLIQVAQRLDHILQGHLVTRLGGDEFAIFVANIASDEDATRLADRIIESFEDPFGLSGMSVEVGASIGLAFSPGHGTDSSTLLQRADVAMYNAKKLKTGYEVYSYARDASSTERLALVGALRAAIENRELHILFQPKVDLAHRRLCGVEALARWEHEERGTILPDAFIPLAEHTGLIRPLTMHVIQLAIEQSKEWQKQGVFLPISVNLSAHNLLDKHLPTEVDRLLRHESIEPAMLTFEITESSVMVDPHGAMAVLRRLDQMGVQLSIDDFGTGYSSLAYLSRLPVGELKIDRSFVRRMLTSSSDAVIVRSTIDLGRNLGLKVVAEGVETEEAFQELRRLGCDSAQGYLMGKPVPATELPYLVVPSVGSRLFEPVP